MTKLFAMFAVLTGFVMAECPAGDVEQSACPAADCVWTASSEGATTGTCVAKS